MCPCQSGDFLQQCCLPYIKECNFASTPEALMRSRFSAFVLNDLAYIEKTQKGPAKRVYEKHAIKNGAKTEWVSLEILDKTDKTVTFRAGFKEGELVKYYEEKSLFKKIDERWYYFKCMGAKHG